MFPASVRYIYPNCFTPLDSSEDELEADAVLGTEFLAVYLKKKKKSIMKCLSDKDNPKG